MAEELDWSGLFEEMKELGIKPEAPKQSNVVTQDTRLRMSFEEIVNFVRKEGREPEIKKGIRERSLAKRLTEFRTNPEKTAAVRDLDVLNLLPHVEEETWSNSDEELLSQLASNDIFDTSSLPQRKAKPDYVANRKPCKEFDKFRPQFEQCHADLEYNNRHIIRITGSHAQQSIGVGTYALIYGLLAYVAEVDEEFVIQGADRKIRNRRMRVIFENGKECDMLQRSFESALYRDGFLISDYDEKEMVLYAEEEEEKTEPRGFIYVLKSASKKPEITAIPNLFKIGVTTTSVEDRIKNAKNETTYLMDDVKIVQTFACYDINVRKLEALIHRFFAICQVDLDVTDKDGYICHPHEWYSVPISVIQQAIGMIVDGSIVNYRYDRKCERLCSK